MPLGSIALVGSGEYLPAMRPFEESLIRDGEKNGKFAKFLQLPTAAGRESDDRLAYWRNLGARQADAMGIEQAFLPVFTREDAFNSEFVSQVDGAALMYISGGDPHYLSECLMGTPLWDAIVANWKSGASLAGCSAGAMVLSEHIPNFRLLKNAPTKGLNLLPNLRVIPHFNKFFKWIPDSAAKVLLHVPDNSILIGVDEMTALVRRAGEESWTVYGEAKVHMLKGMPDQQLHHGEIIQLPESNA